MISIHNDLPSSYVVCDTETTGLNSSSDRLLEVAVLKVTDGIPSDPISKVIKVPFSIPIKITELTGITNKIVEEQGEELNDVLNWLYQETSNYFHVIGHNFFLFDHHFLINESRRVEHILSDALTLNRIIDTAALYKGWGLDIPRHEDDTHADYAKWVLSQRVSFKFNLRHACEQLDIDISQVELHRAAGDVLCTYRLYDALQKMDI